MQGPDERPVVRLTLEDKKVNRNVLPSLSAFPKDAVVGMFGLLHHALRVSVVEYSKKTSDNTIHLMDRMVKVGPESLRKEDLLNLIFLFMSDLSNLLAVADGPMPGLREVWTRLLMGDVISSKELPKLLSVTPALASTTGWSRKYFTDLLLWPAELRYEDYSYYYRTEVKSYEIYLPGMYRKELVMLFFGNTALDPIVTDELPAGKLEVLDYEKEIPTDLVYLAGFDACSLLTAGSNLTQQMLKKVANKLHCGEFPGDLTETDLSRARLLVVAYNEFIALRKDNEPEDMAHFGRYVAKYMGRTFDGVDMGVFLPEFKGFTKPLMEGNGARRIIECVCKLLKPAAKGWLDMSNLELRFICDEYVSSGYSSYVGLFVDSHYRKQKSLRPADKSLGSKYDKPDMWRDLTFPFVMHVIKALCAFGLLEIAVDKGAKASDMLEGVRYVRLTDFGKYALSITKTYVEPKSDADIASFELDDDNLIVTVLSKDSPYLFFLEKIGRKIGSNRFYISAALIVSRSKDAEEAETNIDTFRRWICPDPKGRWKEMIDEARLRVASSIPFPNGYVLKALNPEVPGLLEFVATNPDFAPHILKVQGSRILIDSTYFQTFKEEMHKNGYLI